MRHHRTTSNAGAVRGRGRAKGAVLVLAALAVVAFAPAPAMAAVFTVTSTADSGAGTLRDALAAAAADPAGPHTVVMSPSLGSSATITLTAALSLPNSNITVDGTLSGGARVTISGAGAGGGYTYASIGVHELGHSIGFNTADFVDIGLDVASNELALTNVSLTSTRPLADNLKALVVNNARAALRNVRIEGFTIGGSNIGAAIVLYDSAELDAADLTVARCRSVDGAAILTSGSTPTIACQRCAFLDNESSRNGGAVCLYGGRAVFDRSLFTENSGNTGGAVYISGAPGPVTVTRTYFDSNEAGLGGAIYAASTYLAVRNSAAVNNTASLSGAGLYLSNAFFDLHSVTALNNRAQNGPNNFFTVPSDGSRVSTITNSVYYDALDNIALSGIVYGSSVRLTDNIIKGYNDTATCPETGICATGTVDADPQLVQVVEAQPDNSPVDTFWVPSSGCSPAVNTGDNTGGDAVDMRGDARVVGAAVDRGAVEYAPSRSSNRAALVTGAAAYAVAAGSQLTVAAATGLLSNASDPDCDALTASLVSPPSPAGSGAVTVSPDGSFVFTPAAGFAGTATFVFAVSDGALSTQATARVNVIAAPPAPANNAQNTPPAQATPTPPLFAVEFTVCVGAKNPVPQCGPGRVLALPRFASGAFDTAVGNSKPTGAPKGIELRISKGALKECVAPLPKLKVAPGGASPAAPLKCPGCKRCMRQLGLVKGDSITVAVRARKVGRVPPSTWSSAVAAVL